MQLHKQITFLLSIVAGLFAAQCRAEHSVVYEPYAADDVVMTVGKHKISAAYLAYYGLEPIKVTIKNDSDIDLVFRTDRKSISCEEAYICLGYGFVGTFIKTHLAAAGVATILSLGIWHFIDPWYEQTRNCLNDAAELAWKICSTDEHGMTIGALSKRINKNYNAGIQFWQDRFPEEDVVNFCKAHWPKGVALFAVLTGLSMMELGYFYYAYTYNVSLYSYLQAELLSDELIVPPHQVVTKLMLVKKMEEKHEMA